MAQRRNPYDPTAPIGGDFMGLQADTGQAQTRPGGGRNQFWEELPDPPDTEYNPPGDPNGQPSGDYIPPNGNTGVSGLGGGNNPNPPQTKLYGTLDHGKLANPASPKYKFLSKAQGFSQYDPAAVLAALQGEDAALWGGWSASGDKIRYGGAHNTQDAAFDGLTEFDVVHDFDNPDGPAGWGWQDTRPTPVSGAGGNSTGQTGQMTSSSEIMDALRRLFPNGAFNQDIVNRRTENASAALRRQANQRKANNQAALAERGLIGDGPEGSMFGRVDEDIADRFADEVSGIYADESENADERMIQALQLASGISTADADRALGYLRANNDFSLGQGDLALGNFRAQNDYNLGLGQFGLDRDRLLADIDSSDMDRMVQILQLLLSGAGQSGRGHV